MMGNCKSHQEPVHQLSEPFNSAFTVEAVSFFGRCRIWGKGKCYFGLAPQCTFE